LNIEKKIVVEISIYRSRKLGPTLDIVVGRPLMVMIS
jgi:hypothetical protein